MLKKLGSPRKGSRFVAGARDTKQLSSLDGEVGAPNAASNSRSTPVELTSLSATADPKQDKPGSPGKKSSKKSKKSATPEATTLELGSLGDLASAGSADPKVEDSTVTPDGVAKPPLLRTPRKKSVLDEDGAAPTSTSTPSSPTKDDKRKPRKRDSLGLKSLARRMKRDAHETKAETDDDAKSAMGDIAEQPSDTNSPAKSKRSKDKEPTDRATERKDPKRDKDADDDDARATSALSPIRRKMKSVSDDSEARGGVGRESSTATIREAASILSRRARSRDISPVEQPEVHIIGEIVGGDGFGASADGYCCKWSVDYGNQWIHIAGDQLGQTQIDYSAAAGADRGVVWAHPLDLHFATSTLHGWPKLLLQVWRVDTHMKMNVAGYGFVHLPFAPGFHELLVSMWRPLGTTTEELASQFLGNTPELVSDEVLFNTAWAERCRIRTIATGRVRVSVGIIMRNFESARMDI